MKRLATTLFLLAAAVGITGSTASAIEPSGSLTKAQQKNLIRTANTPADHLKLANYYHFEANKLEAQAKNHEEMGAEYEGNKISHPIPKWPTMGEHCRTLVKNYRDAAGTANEMAAMHEEMAKNVK